MATTRRPDEGSKTERTAIKEDRHAEELRELKSVESEETATTRRTRRNKNGDEPGEESGRLTRQSTIS